MERITLPILGVSGYEQILLSEQESERFRALSPEQREVYARGVAVGMLTILEEEGLA